MRKPLLAILLTLSSCAMTLADYARLQESTDEQNDRAEAAAEAALFAREGLVRYEGSALFVDLTQESLGRCERWRRGENAEPGERATVQVLEVGSKTPATEVSAPLEAACSFLQGSQLLEVTTTTGEVRELMRRPRWLARDASGGLVAYELIPQTKARQVNVDAPCEASMPHVKESVFVRPPATHALWKAPVRRREPVTWEEIELSRSCSY